MIRSAMKLGNPTQTEWPSETLPMNSRIFASGFWNYSFFQFNRKFLPPFWAEEQYNPESPSFMPRSHNILSLNQTQRNWVAIGFPGRAIEASIDMAGGIMVFPGSYTLEFATLDNGKLVRPQRRARGVKLELKSSDRLVCQWRDITIEYRATATGIAIAAKGKSPLVVSVRPFNVEGPALLYKLNYHESECRLTGDADITLKNPPALAMVSDLRNGDALRRIIPRIRRQKREMQNLHPTPTVAHDAKDTYGLTTAAFYFAEASACTLTVRDHQPGPPAELQGQAAQQIIDAYFGETLRATLPRGYGEWFEHAKHHLIALWDFDAIKPGSYTYHHFWIRDAVIMMYALLVMGAKNAVRPIIARFANMVERSGLFKSQSGEWDANGQALWILAEYVRFTHDTSLIVEFKSQITRMLAWVEKTTAAHGGVLPPGFSAEHLGPADWYLWDNFWSLGGLKAIAPYLNEIGLAERAEQIYTRLAAALNGYLEPYRYLPAALGRGKDAGMIGSIAAAYPLQLSEFCDERLLRTLDIIRENYFFHGCFFQENIHSGLNPYLTLQTAESYLYFGKTAEARRMLRSVKARAQKAYTFPEAIHVRTGGGCMGDGFHGWASAESIIMLRNLIVREVRLADSSEALIWLSGFRDKWLKEGATAENIYTPWSVVRLTLAGQKLELTGLTHSVQNIFSLPQGYTIVDAATGKPLARVPHVNIMASLSDERDYFALDTQDNATLRVVG